MGWGGGTLDVLLLLLNSALGGKAMCKIFLSLKLIQTPICYNTEKSSYHLGNLKELLPSASVVTY